MSAFSAVTASWQNFYLLVGTAAATLIGLMFVAVTFGSSIVTKDTNPEATRAWLDPTLTHFVQVLITACLLAIPTMGPTLLGVLLIVLGLLRVAALFTVHRHMKAAQQKHNDLELSDWMTGIILPFAAYTALIGSGVAFILGHNAFNVLAIVTIAILLNGIYGAWELMVWMALVRSRSK